MLAACSLTPAVPPPPVIPDETARIEDWQTPLPGLALRYYAPGRQRLALIAALRIDPALYTFRVHYRPGAPLTVTEWETELPDAVAILNANFFDGAANVVGLLVADGVAHGRPYTDRGGTFGLLDDAPLIRGNIAEPYQGEPYSQAVQGFPLLVWDGQTAYTTRAGDRATRRSAIGMDAEGRVVLLATPLTGLGLADFAAYLPTTDLGLVHAFNLDGGGSTLLSVPSAGVRILSRDPVPAVLAVYPR